MTCAEQDLQIAQLKNQLADLQSENTELRKRAYPANRTSDMCPVNGGKDQPLTIINGYSLVSGLLSQNEVQDANKNIRIFVILV